MLDIDCHVSGYTMLNDPFSPTDEEPGHAREGGEHSLQERRNLAKNAPPCCSACGSIHQFAQSLGNTIDAKDCHTAQHSEQVAVLAFALALECGVSRAVACDIHIAGHLHDLGKIAIPDHILCKPGPLTDDEWEVMKLHPIVGAQIVAPVKALNMRNGIATMILHHHERVDGKGYPHGLRGKKIPFGARVLSVADSVSAMMQDRPYRSGCTLTQAASEVQKMAGSQFDPDVALSFMNLVGAIQQAAPHCDGVCLFDCITERCAHRGEDSSVVKQQRRTAPQCTLQA